MRLCSWFKVRVYFANRLYDICKSNAQAFFSNILNWRGAHADDDACVAAVFSGSLAPSMRLVTIGRGRDWFFCPILSEFGPRRRRFEGH